MSVEKIPFTPYSRPCEGSAGQTGFWRVFKPVIDQSKCIHCLLCWLYCPEGTIKRVGDDGLRVEVDYKYCKGCGVCANECPVKAIEMVLEE